MRSVHDYEAKLVTRRANHRDLVSFERSEFSQNGEDGIIKEIVRRLSITGGFCVEFGAADGTQNCTRSLIQNHGWSGLWIESDELLVKTARHLMEGAPVRVESAMITRENILALFSKGQVPRSFDLLVVDIDGNDWWVAERILGSYRPRVVAIEYNATMGPKRWTMPYDPTHEWHQDRWHGASLSKLTELLHGSGYSLVATDTLGVNAFFVLAEFGAHFVEPGNVEFHFTPPRYSVPFGHPWQEATEQYEPLRQETGERYPSRRSNGSTIRRRSTST